MDLVWRDLVETYSERTLWVACTAVHALVFASFSLFFFLMHQTRILAHYKIQPLKYPSGELLRKGLADVAVKHALSPFIFYLLWPFAQYCGIHATALLPSLTEVLVDMGVYMIVQDTIFYWSHRMLHLPYFYKRIHKKHHQFYTPVALSAEYAHPVEDFFNHTAFIAGPLIMGSHVATIYLWFFVRIWETVDAHSGYALPFPLSPFSPFGVADRHDYHHSQNKGCFGSFFAIWDKICGTDADFLTWKASTVAATKEVPSTKARSQ
jgi:sterol desaturase/sphingolipid hydroxylase (fatty acid hydroxylase superfamily)